MKFNKIELKLGWNREEIIRTPDILYVRGVFILYIIKGDEIYEHQDQ